MRSAVGAFLKVFFCLLVAFAPATRSQAGADAPLFYVLSADETMRFAVTEDVIRTVGTRTFRSALPSISQPNFEVTGPLVRDIIAAAGLQGTTLTVRALDGYEMDIPAGDYLDNDVILAFEVDGKRLSRRERGPVWIAYPSVEYPRFQDDVYLARSVWQVRELIVK